jgi:hypothetical protein
MHNAGTIAFWAGRLYEMARLQQSGGRDESHSVQRFLPLGRYRSEAIACLASYDLRNFPQVRTRQNAAAPCATTFKLV